MKSSAICRGLWAAAVVLVLGGGFPIHAQTLGDLGGLGDPLALADTKPPYTIETQFTAADGDKPPQLFVTVKIDKGWHIYSMTQPPDVGPVATQITLDDSDQYQLAGEFKVAPEPDSHPEPAFDNQLVEEHHGTVTWYVPLKLSAGADPASLKIGGTILIQACDSRNCLRPTNTPFTAALGKGVKVETEPKQTQVYQGKSLHAAISGILSPPTVEPGQRVVLALTARPQPEYHVYPWAPRPYESGEQGTPTLIVLTETSIMTAGAVTPSAPPVEKPLAGQTGHVSLQYDQPVTWSITLTVPKDALPGEYPVSGLIGFQTCKDTACDFPRAAQFTGQVKVVAPQAAAAAPENGVSESGPAVPLAFREAKYGEVASIAATMNPEATGFDETLVAQNVKDDSTALEIVLGAFFGGMILNLMPCVFPVIGLKILSFVQQSHHDRGRLLALNLWYSLGVILVFLGLAATAVLLRQFVGVDFKYGNQNSLQGYLIGMAALMFVMGLSLMGVWEIHVPGFVGGGKAGEAMAREGAWGAVAKGAITTLLGASCSAPVVAVAFGFALDKSTPVWATFGTFTLIGIGMATPYLILGANPSLLRFLPKPGPWMETFKHLCGFVMMGAMVWVLTLLKIPNVVPTVAFLMGLWFACWRIGRVPFTKPLGTRLRSWVEGTAVAVAVGWFAFTYLASNMMSQLNDEFAVLSRENRQVDASMAAAPNESQLPWQPFSKDLLTRLTREKKTVMVDFTAIWCPNCKALERYVLNTEDVKEAVARTGVVPLVADYTDAPPELTNMLTALKAGGIPVLAIFPADNPNNPIVFRGGYTKQTLIDALDEATPDKTRNAKREMPSEVKETRTDVPQTFNTHASATSLSRLSK